MTQLYSTLAEICHKMYQHVFDYDLEFQFYNTILKNNNFGNFEQNIEHGNKKIRRISHLEKNLATGWTWDWKAKYIIEKEGEVSEYDDLTTLRAFTRDEIELFLKLAGFGIEEIIEEGKAFTVIARKK